MFVYIINNLRKLLPCLAVLKPPFLLVATETLTDIFPDDTMNLLV